MAKTGFSAIRLLSARLQAFLTTRKLQIGEKQYENLLCELNKRANILERELLTIPPGKNRLF